MAEAKEIEAKVDEILSTAGVVMSATLVGPARRDAWECDAWLIAFKKDRDLVTFDYFTGTGHRKRSPAHERMFRQAVKGLRPNCLAYESAEKTYPAKPVPPTAASVLYCLVSDAEALHQSFSDWCATFGSDEDSIKALNTYQACCETGKKLNKLFDRATIAQLQEALQDY